MQFIERYTDILTQILPIAKNRYRLAATASLFPGSCHGYSERKRDKIQTQIPSELFLSRGRWRREMMMKPSRVVWSAPWRTRVLCATTDAQLQTQSKTHYCLAGPLLTQRLHHSNQYELSYCTVLAIMGVNSETLRCNVYNRERVASKTNIRSNRPHPTHSLVKCHVSLNCQQLIHPPQSKNEPMGSCDSQTGNMLTS